MKNTCDTFLDNGIQFIGVSNSPSKRNPARKDFGVEVEVVEVMKNKDQR
jgi:hypothetical protein